MQPGLYLVATPIGNLGDISARALETLGEADIVACEDTRNTGKLLNRFGIEKNMVAYHEHNAKDMCETLAKKIQNGAAVALVTDAGTPLVSDPGYRLVQKAKENNLLVTALPGPCAAVNALVLSGLPCHRFMFAGFLPPKTHARKKSLQELANIDTTLVFYEAPHRLVDCIADMTEIFGAERSVCYAREMTKLYEEVVTLPLGEMRTHLDNTQIKGEVVLVVEPPVAGQTPDYQDIAQMLAAELETKSPSDAAATLSKTTGIPRKKLYKQALALKNEAKNGKA